MGVEARGGRWSWNNIQYRIQYCAHNKLRYRELTFWRRWWSRFWGWFFRGWQTWIYPHLMPRTYFREMYELYLGLRIPPCLNGFVWGSPEEGYCAQAIEQDGPWELCCFCGWTADEAWEDMVEVLSYWAKEAGTIDDGWSIERHNREPTNDDRTYTR